MQKFTEKQKADFDRKCRQAKDETEAKYTGHITSETAHLEKLIEKAKKNKDADQRRKLQKELKEFQKKMLKKIAKESRQLLKQTFSYPIFLYDAEKVGITATGDDDENELYPNARMPKGIKKTCLEHYRSFLRKAQQYLIEENEK